MSRSRDNEDSLDPSAVTIFDLRSTLPIAVPTFDSGSSAYTREFRSRAPLFEMYRVHVAERNIREIDNYPRISQATVFALYSVKKTETIKHVFLNPKFMHIECRDWRLARSYR